MAYAREIGLERPKLLADVTSIGSYRCPHPLTPAMLEKLRDKVEQLHASLLERARGYEKEALKESQREDILDRWFALVETLPLALRQAGPLPHAAYVLEQASFAPLVLTIEDGRKLKKKDVRAVFEAPSITVIATAIITSFRRDAYRYLFSISGEQESMPDNFDDLVKEAQSVRRVFRCQQCGDLEDEQRGAPSIFEHDCFVSATEEACVIRRMR